MPRPRSQQVPHNGRGFSQCAVIVDGETEVIYIDKMRACERVSIKGVEADGDVDKQFSQARRLHDVDGYANVYWLIDYDVIARDNRQCIDASKKKLTLLKQYMQRATSMPWLHIIFNSPCLEYWLLLHFEPNNHRAYEQFDGDLETALRKHLTDYEKTRKYYESGLGIYRKLRSRLATARQAASGLTFNPKSGQCAPTAEIYRIFDNLGIK